MKIFNREFKLFATDKELVEVESAKKNREIITNISEIQLQRINNDVAKFRNSLTAAENILQPNRLGIHEIYAEIKLDTHLSSVLETRKKKTLTKPFKVVAIATGEEDKSKTQLLKKKSWFDKTMELGLDSLFDGQSLIQLNGLANLNFQDVKLVPRQYVKPEFGLVVKQPSDTKGVSYEENTFDNLFVIPAYKDRRDLGILLKVSKLLLYKKAVEASFAQFAHIYGIPFKVLTTDATGQELLKYNTMMRGITSSFYAILPTEDKLEFIEPSNGDGNVFMNFIKMCDEQVSKAVLGGTAMSDMKSHVGSAEVQERVAEEIAMSDMRYIENWVNDTIFPKLNKLGFGFEGYQFQFDFSEKVSTMDKLEIVKVLMTGYDIDEQYILNEFGVPVVKKETPSPEGANFQKGQTKK